MKWLVLLILLPLLLVAAGLALNRPPLLAPPGPLERLRTYLSTNVAETRPDHPFAELRTPLIPADPAQTRAAVLRAVRSLGWQEAQEEEGEIRAVVVSPIFRFSDDLSVRLGPAQDGTLLAVRSASRVGKGDLAANARHIEDLVAAVRGLVAGQTREGSPAAMPPR